MYKTIKINDEWLPEPDKDLQFSAEKVKNEKETEAGTTMVIVTRPTRISVSGSFTVTGAWMEKLRSYREADTVKLSCYYPETSVLSDHTCQFEITKETHVAKSREQLPRTRGLYQVDVTITEL